MKGWKGSLRNRLRLQKKAFTMVEMLICVVCIGLLTIAVTSFHTLLNNQMIKMQDREVAALLEYSDLSRLREKNVIDDDFLDTLNNPEMLRIAHDIKLGDTAVIEYDILLLAGQTVIYESYDASIVAVDQDSGTILPIAPGITYVIATLCEEDASGRTVKTSNSAHIPVRIYDDDTASLLLSSDVYYYSGVHHQGWLFYKDGGV